MRIKSRITLLTAHLGIGDASNGEEHEDKVKKIVDSILEEQDIGRVYWTENSGVK